MLCLFLFFVVLVACGCFLLFVLVSRWCLFAFVVFGRVGGGVCRACRLADPALRLGFLRWVVGVCGSSFGLFGCWGFARGGPCPCVCLFWLPVGACCFVLFWLPIGACFCVVFRGVLFVLGARGCLSVLFWLPIGACFGGFFFLLLFTRCPAPNSTPRIRRLFSPPLLHSVCDSTCFQGRSPPRSLPTKPRFKRSGFFNASGKA